MKHAIITIGCVALLLTIAVSCGTHSDISVPHSSKISDWQDREWECQGYTISYRDSGCAEVHDRFDDMKKALWWARWTLEFQRQSRAYVPDGAGVDYWQTSCESQRRRDGDCDDAAIMIYYMLRKYYFPDNCIKLVIGEHYIGDKLRAHMFAAVYYSETDFYILDATGAYTKNIVKSEDFFALHDNIRLVVEFDLFSCRFL